jgi:UDP-N-acetylmuramate: L-alanyl-gamma-D-glutamyl-meso-diaminopimelate ligase
MGNDTLIGALVHPAGRTKITDEDKKKRLESLKALGIELTELMPEVAEFSSLTAGKPLERALLLSQALTQRKFSLIWASRGGYGTTELIRFLESALPPILPAKTFVGFSDNSFIGNYLALRHPNLTYVHANHALDPSLLDGDNNDSKILLDIINNRTPAPVKFSVKPAGKKTIGQSKLSGPCIPFNLSLAESFSALKHVQLPEGCVLFLEDINEELFRISRKFDSLLNSGFLDRCSAIVIGNFTDCPKNESENATEEEIAQIFARKVNVPVVVAPVFGHAKARLPLVAHSTAEISLNNGEAQLTVQFSAKNREGLATKFPADLFMPKAGSAEFSKPNIHFTGVGGTGMAAVAGLFASAKFNISGSDNPIYPPMDEVIRHIGLKQIVGYNADTITQTNPDAVILANVITRRNAELKPNLEMESLLQSDIPVMSFPSALRKYFLHGASNIIVSGTHGKTSTTSLIAQMLEHLGLDPSLFVGGAPANFQHGYKLGSKRIFVLEGDEYDSALFDKGPKFLHYEPKIALINNIEFDHADIYPDIGAIEEEFYRLACLTRDRGGIVVANADDERVVKIVERAKAPVLWFGQKSPHWIYKNSKTLVDGTIVTVRTPSGTEIDLRLKMFGHHNAMNATAAMAVIQALHITAKHPRSDQSAINSDSPAKEEIQKWADASSSFLGVKRRFELIGQIRDIAIFDDFAHHPTAIATTLDAFKSYTRSSGRKGRLIACFDPRNATMRRSVLQKQLAGCFEAADVVFLGKVPVDLRLKENEALNGPQVVDLIGNKAKYFSDNDVLLSELIASAKSGDTVVFMSSGSFDGLPRKLFAALERG